MIQRQAGQDLWFAISKECVQSCKLAPLTPARVDICLPSLPAQCHLHIFNLQLLLLLLYPEQKLWIWCFHPLGLTGRIVSRINEGAILCFCHLFPP